MVAIYEPGLPFLPFGDIQAQQIIKPRRRFLPAGVDLVLGEIARVDTDANMVLLAGGRELPYDFLSCDRGEPTPGPDARHGGAAVAAQHLRLLHARRRDREWTEALAQHLAAGIGIELSDAHWKAIRFLRVDFRTQGETATLRRVATVGGIPLKELFALFPGKPAKKMACGPYAGVEAIISAADFIEKTDGAQLVFI